MIISRRRISGRYCGCDPDKIPTDWDPNGFDTSLSFLRPPFQGDNIDRPRSRRDPASLSRATERWIVPSQRGPIFGRPAGRFSPGTSGSRSSVTPGATSGCGSIAIRPGGECSAIRVSGKGTPPASRCREPPDKRSAPRRCGSHADDEIHPVNTIDDEETSVIASDREPPGAILIASS